MNYFELKVTEKKQLQEKLSAFPYLPKNGTYFYKGVSSPLPTKKDRS